MIVLVSLHAQSHVIPAVASGPPQPHSQLHLASNNHAFRRHHIPLRLAAPRPGVHQANTDRHIVNFRSIEKTNKNSEGGVRKGEHLAGFHCGRSAKCGAYTLSSYLPHVPLLLTPCTVPFCAAPPVVSPDHAQITCSVTRSYFTLRVEGLVLRYRLTRYCSWTDIWDWDKEIWEYTFSAKTPLRLALPVANLNEQP